MIGDDTGSDGSDTEHVSGILRIHSDEGLTSKVEEEEERNTVTLGPNRGSRRQIAAEACQELCVHKSVSGQAGECPSGSGCCWVSGVPGRGAHLPHTPGA